MTVPRASSEIEIDGIVEEQAWDEALRLELRYEVQPGENIEPPVTTIVFFTFDERNVLVAFRCYDPEPQKIRARYRDRDQVGADDYVGITLDTFNDERRAYEFMINPLGVQSDGIYEDLRQDYDESWDGIWFSAGRLTDFGYEVEVAIPFNQIRFQKVSGPQVWGLDLTRSYPRANRYRIGLFPRDRGANSYLGQEEKIIGFESVSPGRNLEFAPTVTGFVSEERPDFPDSITVTEDRNLELGATGRWGLSPNVTLTGALNPDFSQVEADAYQLTINQRFELSYDEKRPFFLESRDYFETGVDLLYTRLITDPLAALKLTAKMGRHTGGVFTARDEVTNLIVPGVQESEAGAFESANTSTVARYRYDLVSDSTVGALLTDREGGDGYFNRVASLDLRLRPTDSNLIAVDAAWSSTRYSPEMQREFDLEADEFSDHGLRFEYTHTERDWFAFVEYTDLGDGFRADLGFVPQVGFRQGVAGAGYVWWGDNSKFFNMMEIGGVALRSEDQGGTLLTSIQEAWFSYDGPLQSELHVDLQQRTEVYEGIRFDNLLIPFIRAEMRPTAWLEFDIEWVSGDWIDFDHARPANRTLVAGEIDLNLGRHLELELSHLNSRLDVEGGRLYDADVSRLRAVWQFTARTFVRAILQHSEINRTQELYEDVIDELERDFFVQFLFSYKLNPQTVAFLGYSEGGTETQDLTMTTTGRAVFLKIGYAWLW